MPSLEIEKAMKDLLPFLKWHSPFSYKTQVLEHLLGMTGTNEGCLSLAHHLELNKTLIELVICDRSNDIKGGRMQLCLFHCF